MNYTRCLCVAKLRLFAFALVFQLGFLPWASAQEQQSVQVLSDGATQAPKVVILYSDIGKGHESAAQAIANDVLLKRPDAQIEIKNIRDFYKSARAEKLDRKLFWFVVKRFPKTFDKMYHASMKKGLQSNSFSERMGDYNMDETLKYIEGVKPDTIISTHYGSTEVLAALREKGKLLDQRIGWLHTDYITQYFPKISKAIEKSFLPHEALEKEWIKAGVKPDQIASTGMPVNKAAFEPADPGVFEKLKVSPDMKTVVIATGGEGVGDFPAIVKSIQAKWAASPNAKDPIQIIAACANSEENYKALMALKDKLPANIHVHPFKMVPQKDLLDIIKQSDLYITKSGGLSPTEAFVIQKPTVLLDIYGGHERENAVLFKELGLARINNDYAKIGDDVVDLMNAPDEQLKMMAQQRKFRDGIRISQITDFVLGDTPAPETHLPKNLGAESGDSIRMGKEALEALEKAAPADIEILLSDSTYTMNKKIDMNDNPFGHIALSIDGKVYSINSLAKPGVESQVLPERPLHEYLFATDRKNVNEYAGSQFGEAYSRNVNGLRVQGISAEKKKAMIEKIKAINSGYDAGSYCYVAKTNNCSDAVEEVLKAGGIDLTNSRGPNHKVNMPLDLFDRATQYVQKQPELRVDLVSYKQIHGSKAQFKYSRFPLSLGQLPRSIRNLRKPGTDPLEHAATKHIRVYPATNEASLDRVDSRDYADVKSRLDQFDSNIAEKRAALLMEESVLDTELRRMKADQPVEALLAAHKKDPEALKRGLAQYRAYQQRMDDHSIKHMDLLIDQTERDILKLTDEAEGKLPAALKAKLDAALLKMRKQHDIFQSLKTSIKDPKLAVERGMSYKAYFEEAKNLVAMLQGHYGLSNAAPRPPFVSRFIAGVKKTFVSLARIARASPAVASLLGEVLRPSKNPLDNKFLPKVRKAFNALADVTDKKVDLKGMEHVKKAGPKEIRIFAPTHRDPLTDIFPMAKLGGDNQLLFMAPDAFAPKPLADLIDRQPDIMTVGRGSDKPIEKALDFLKNAEASGKALPDLMIYPEGSVHVGVGETRPARDKFSTGLIKRLQDQGYKVTIHPVTYTKDPPFLGRAEFAPNKIEAVVRPAITDEQIRALRSVGDDVALGEVIRASWLEDMPTDARHLAGKLKVEESEKLLSQTLYGRSPAAATTFDCSHLYENLGWKVK